MIMTTSIAISAISNKFTNNTSLGLVALTITFSLRLADLVTNIVTDLARFELMMKINVVRLVL